ncbi:hypothetical protein AND_003537 [Anopheles darlingi]|uniref:RING-type domain-containing protein n=2 Tax=Anopheles darlingi TaxID=43151 RepID=W5JKP1_ANODA|nr:hypothetical protein AND_003537 [Anopheles darlingi]
MGLDLIDLLEIKGYEVMMNISEGSRQFRPLGNINRTSVLFVSISFIVLMIISLVWLVFYYVQRFRYLQTKDKQSKRLCTAAKRIIAKIPTKSIKSDDKEIDNDCCAICIEPYKVTDVIRVLPCKHEFHKVCIDPWLLEHRTCPMCKMDILKHYGFVVGSSSAQINAAIAEYLNVVPPPPSSNTSTITTSSITSTESRRTSWVGNGTSVMSANGGAGGRVDTIPSNLLGDGYGTGSPGTSGGVAGQLTDIVTIIINIDDTAGPSDGVAAGSSGSSNSSNSTSSSTSVGNGGGGGWTSNAGMSSNARDSNNDSSIICDSSESNSNSQLINKQMIGD